MSRKSLSKPGSTKAEILNLTTSISVAMGLLGTLSLRHPYLWTRKLQSMDPEHLRILLSEVMDEIYTAETSIQNLQQILKI